MYLFHYISPKKQSQEFFNVDFSFFNCLFPFIIIITAIVIAKIITAPPVSDSIIWLNSGLSFVPNVVL